MFGTPIMLLRWTSEFMQAGVKYAVIEHGLKQGGVSPKNDNNLKI
jgi:hypothetical protein